MEDGRATLILRLPPEFRGFGEQQNNYGNAFLSYGQKAVSLYFSIKFMKHRCARKKREWNGEVAVFELTRVMKRPRRRGAERSCRSRCALPQEGIDAEGCAEMGSGRGSWFRQTYLVRRNALHSAPEMKEYAHIGVES
jgi:hypothetical protein